MNFDCEVWTEIYVLAIRMNYTKVALELHGKQRQRNEEMLKSYESVYIYIYIYLHIPCQHVSEVGVTAGVLFQIQVVTHAFIVRS